MTKGEIKVKNEKKPIGDLIQEYEENLYEKYRNYKIQFGKYSDYTQKVHVEWRQIVKFTYDYNITSNFTLKDYDNILNELRGVLEEKKKEKGFPEYWAAINAMFIKISQTVEGLYENELRKIHK